jgi:hypothetical protein
LSLFVSIYWSSLVPDQVNNTQSGLVELSEKLRQKYPDLPWITLHELTPFERQCLPDFFDDPSGYLDDNPTANPLKGKQVFLFCDYDYPAARTARKDQQMAKLGAAWPGVWALAWTPDNKYLLWHEAMHLLNAMDCYDEDGKTNCGERRCLMQYVPCEKNCESDLYLCSSNVSHMNSHLP